MGFYGWDDCPVDIRQQISQLRDGVRAVLADDLIGVYLHGSLAIGCFNPLRSDVDLLIITRQWLSVEVKRQMAELLLTLSGQPSPIEISFLACGDLTPWCHPAAFDLHYSEAWRVAFVRDLENGAWRSWNGEKRRDPDLAAHITVLRHRGVCLEGRPIAEVFPTVPRGDYLAAVLGDVLDAQFGLASDLAQPVYVILNACRTYAYLRTGAVLSKEEGGVWALGVVPERWRPLLTALLEVYRDRGDDGDLDHDLVGGLANYLRMQIVALI